MKCDFLNALNVVFFVTGFCLLIKAFTVGAAKFPLRTVAAASPVKKEMIVFESQIAPPVSQTSGQVIVVSPKRISLMNGLFRVGEQIPNVSDVQIFFTELGLGLDDEVDSNPHTGSYRNLSLVDQSEQIKVGEAQFVWSGEENSFLQNLHVVIGKSEVSKDALHKWLGQRLTAQDPSSSGSGFKSWMLNHDYSLWVTEIGSEDLQDNPEWAAKGVQLGDLHIGMDLNLHGH